MQKKIYEQNIASEIKQGKHSMEKLPYNNHYEKANTKTLLTSLPWVPSNAKQHKG